MKGSIYVYISGRTDSDRSRTGEKDDTGAVRQTCILQVKYDPATLTPRDNPQYEICARHRGFIENYTEVLGCELVHDAQEHIFRLSESICRVRS